MAGKLEGQVAVSPAVREASAGLLHSDIDRVVRAKPRRDRSRECREGSCERLVITDAKAHEVHRNH